tara:strand:+ start:314 stop:445 length:132 start_codon:yes stop_codon:yes gene_type:complete
MSKTQGIRYSDKIDDDHFVSGKAPFLEPKKKREYQCEKLTQNN